MVFQSQQVFGYDDHMTPIRTGLDNWIKVWGIYMYRYSITQRHSPRPIGEDDLDSMWQRIGFYHSSDEYWMLAKLMVDRVTTSKHHERDQALKDGFSTDDARARDGLLAKYDETSMSQVNELIADFQRVLT